MTTKNRKTKELPLHWRGSFTEYLEWAKQDPRGNLRTARQYLYDAILSFGTETVRIKETDEELTRYTLFTVELPHRKEVPVHGMDRSLEILMRHLESRAVRMHDLPRMIVLNGPPGSSKSSIVERMKVALEEYSLTDKGASFTTTVLLPINDDPKKKDHIGFIPEEEEKVNGSYAHLDKDKIYAQITCPQHDSPLLWYPREVRKEKLEELLTEAGISIDDIEIPDEMLYGELCPVCSQMQDHLMAEHDDDLEEVLKYVRVDRVRFKGGVAGIATVAPGTSHNFTALSLTLDPSYQKFTDRFPGIKLVELDGAFLKANRGLIHLEDFVKASKGGNLNYLLRAISNGQLTTKDQRTGKEITVTVDEIILSTDNVEEIETLRQMGSKGLDSRVFVIDWPYVLEGSEEEKIYITDFAESGCSDFTCVRDDLPHITPHVKELAALFTVMTRYERPDTDNYRYLDDFSDDLKTLINSLTPFDKVQLYGGQVPERFTKEQARLLTKQVWRAIRNEYPNEGLIGVGVRDIQEVVNLLEVGEDCACIRPTDLFNVLDEFIKTGSFHYIKTDSEVKPNTPEFKSFALQEPTLGYHDVDRCLVHTRWKYDLTVSREVREAMTNISPETMCEWIQEYVGLVTESYDPKFLEGPEVDASKDDDDVEEKLSEFEVLLDLKDKSLKDKFRNEVRARFAKYTGQLDTSEGYRRVFPELYKAIEEDRFEKVRDRFFIDDVVKPEFLEAVSKFDPAKPASTLTEDMRKDLIRIFDNMRGFGYCTECTQSTLIYALDNELV